MRTAAVEDYAKAIFTLEGRTAQPVSTTALAERLGITAGSVSAMLRKLDELGLITHLPYRGVRLTPEGRRLALEIVRHHRLLELSSPSRSRCPGTVSTMRPRCSSTSSPRSSRR